ncbi:MAG: hypothetical protein ACE5HB_10135 [Terriglobia bacterium]
MKCSVCHKEIKGKVMRRRPGRPPGMFYKCDVEGDHRVHLLVWWSAPKADPDDQFDSFDLDAIEKKLRELE